MSESAVQMLLELQQAWCHDRFPGEPVAVPDHPLSGEPVPSSRPDPSLTQLHAFPLGPITVTRWGSALALTQHLTQHLTHIQLAINWNPQNPFCRKVTCPTVCSYIQGCSVPGIGFGLAQAKLCVIGDFPVL